MKNRKGIILAGGSGTRLYPLTLAISKQIMPVYDKPMIYYPLSVLMEAGIREVLIITTQRDSETFKALLGDGSQWGMKYEYKVQAEPRGLADAFIIGEKFIGDDNNEEYMKQNRLYVETFGRKMTWFDTGTHDALLETASFVQTIEKRQGMQVCCPEEIAYQKGWITDEQLSKLADKYMKTDYGKYLKNLIKGV